MNSFLKGFLSLFDWMNPKTLDESMDDLDNSMQNLYDRMGWGLYINPWEVNTAGDLTRSIKKDTIEEVYGDVRVVTSSQFLDEMIKLVPSGKFQPYAYYNADMDSIQVYFKDEGSYTQPLNQNVEIHLSHDTDEIAGATILNIKQLIEGKR